MACEFAAGQHIVANRDFAQAVVSITRSSMPSKRPARMVTPGPREFMRHCLRQARRAASCRSAAQPDFARAWSSAGPSTSARSTMPAPPPVGVSSTWRWLADSEVADLDRVKRPDVGVQRLARERRAERPWKHLREQRQHDCAPSRLSCIAGWEVGIQRQLSRFTPSTVTVNSSDGCRARPCVRNAFATFDAHVQAYSADLA